MSELIVSKIKNHFPNHTIPCLKTFLLLMNCILQCRTVCLYKCRDKVKSTKKQNVNNDYARLIRFFKMKNIKDFIAGISTLMFSIGEVDLTYLIVDRTNWKRGAKNFNLLTIGNLKQNNFIPLHWLQLNKSGGSNTNDRKTLIEGMCTLAARVGKTIKGSILLADREFIGQEWFEYLLSKELSFVIRLREKMYFELQTNEGKRKTSLKSFRKSVEKYGIFAIPMILGDTTYTFVMIKNPKYDPKVPYIYFISDINDARAIANHYLKRWKIECCFKHLKSNGFNIENINLKNDDKIELMMGILAIVYLIALKAGLLRHLEKPIPAKKYKNGKVYLSISIFRMGLAIIQFIFTTIKKILTYIEHQLKANKESHWGGFNNFIFLKYV